LHGVGGEEEDEWGLVDAGGKALVEGASKALATNRERVMSWMKDLRPKEREVPSKGDKREALSAQVELQDALRRLYLEVSDPPLHTAMVVAKARPPPSGAGAGA
ncbi:unnamed protein product, partial [Discosporangium mesarthrocarpum]